MRVGSSQEMRVLRAVRVVVAVMVVFALRRALGLGLRQVVAVVVLATVAVFRVLVLVLRLVVVVIVVVLAFLGGLGADLFGRHAARVRLGAELHDGHVGARRAKHDLLQPAIHAEADRHAELALRDLRHLLRRGVVAVLGAPRREHEHDVEPVARDAPRDVPEREDRDGDARFVRGGGGPVLAAVAGRGDEHDEDEDDGAQNRGESRRHEQASPGLWPGRQDRLRGGSRVKQGRMLLPRCLDLAP